MAYAIRLNYESWHVFDYQNLLLWLNNYQNKINVDDFPYVDFEIKEVTNYVKFQRIINQFDYVDNLIFYGFTDIVPIIRNLSHKQIKEILVDTEELRHKHKNNKIFNYNRQANLLGREIKSSMSDKHDWTRNYYNVYQPKHGKSPKSHTIKSYTFKNSKNNRRNWNTFRRSAISFNEIVNLKLECMADDKIIYQKLPFTHQNRHTNSVSYVFDDTKHMRSRRSSGWKNRKIKHQYLVNQT